MTPKLKRFRVTNFRSVDDSGWVEVDDVTALIGTNESGKTNMLLPLWKLNPAKEGAIHPTSDYPRKYYNKIRHEKPKPVFIEAIFDVGTELARQLADETGMPIDQMREVSMSRRFEGEPVVDFPNATPARDIDQNRALNLLSRAETDLTAMTALKTEEDLKNLALAAIGSAKTKVSGFNEIGPLQLDELISAFGAVKTDNAPKTSTVVPRYLRLSEELEKVKSEISREHPREVESAVNLVLESLPKFVYYSNYGNLDSEIYLPHVIQNMSRADIGAKEQAKARTLKVLFEFVRLQPKEILELGRDFKDPQNRQPTDDEIAAIAEKKKQRSILLQSASTLLTMEFRSWWRQGEYRFRFEADGDHFRIWVSDDKRPEEIELEGRSTGIQWFLSFYLVFLVESADAHQGAILLLDEPGISLHPLAQRDLSEFFDSLAETNQLIYTSHSPFLVDADRLDRARKVYVGEDGTSKISPDLRASDGDITQRGAGYAVHAALGLTVAESLLLGCEPVIVEGPSDQHYLNGIKTLLIASGRLKPGRELVFPPAGGAKGVKAVASILGGRDEELPVALFDSDLQGRNTAKSLREGLYVAEPNLVLEIGSFTGMADSEIEDLAPPELVARELDRWQCGSDVPFAEEMKSGAPIVPQIEAWAMRNKVQFAKPGWKVELAKRVKQRLLVEGAQSQSLSSEILDLWQNLFNAFQAARSSAKASAPSGKVGAN
ncbi:AAA family ATPase [Candidatus Binatus sp.]|uniref:AAA family ATPase n=1 Tax=Candidatus Binatus sp. TaxID=2811406 RepID=UPI003BAFEAD0